jgi:hypothetical protein
MRRPFCAILLLALLPACSVWFFSGESWIDRSRPAVLVETTGGVELGVATEFGVLTLGRTATEGPCRVHYFLGPTPLVDAGMLQSTGSTFTQAEIDLKTQAVRVLDRNPTADDDLIAMWTPDGETTTSIRVNLAHAEGVSGDVLEHPGTELPPGACILRRGEGNSVQFVGLVAGKATCTNQAGTQHYYVYAGLDRVRELIARPQQYPTDLVPKYRTDDITVMRPQKPMVPATTEAAPGKPGAGQPGPDGRPK